MFSGVAATTVNTVVMAVAYPLYLYFLGYEKYGVWLVLATVLTFVQLGNLGIGPAVMKLVAEEYGRSDIEAVRRYITAALVMLCISGTVALIVILTFKSQIISLFKLSDENAATVSWLLPYIGVLSIYVFVVQVFDAALSGLGRMDLSNYIQSLGRIVTIIVAMVLLFGGRGIESLFIGSVVSYLLIHIATIICILRIAPIRLLRINNFDTHCCKQLLRFGGGVLGGSLINIIYHSFNKILLSRYAGVSTISVYEIAFNGSMQIRGLLEAGLRAMLPEISRISGNITESRRGRIVHLNMLAMKLILVVGVPVYGVLIWFSTALLTVWIGAEHVEALRHVFPLMLVVSLVSLFAVPAYYTLMGIGRVLPCFLSQAISMCVHVVIILTILVFTSALRVEYVAYAAFAGISAATCYLFWQSHRSYASMVIKDEDVVVQGSVNMI